MIKTVPANRKKRGEKFFKGCCVTDKNSIPAGSNYFTTHYFSTTSCSLLSHLITNFHKPDRLVLNYYFRAVEKWEHGS